MKKDTELKRKLAVLEERKANLKEQLVAVESYARQLKRELKARIKNG